MKKSVVVVLVNVLAVTVLGAAALFATGGVDVPQRPMLRKLEVMSEGEALSPFARVIRDGAMTRSADVAPRVAAEPPVRLGFEKGDDWEPSIAADRFGHVYAFWNHYGRDPYCPGCVSPHMELQVSADNGATWSDPRPVLPNASVRQDDPQIVIDPVDGRTVYTSFMLGDKASMVVAKSTDLGKTWTRSDIEDLERGTDKEILAVRGDDVYVAYNAAQKIYVSASHNGGQTWSTRAIVPNTNSTFGWSLPSGGAVDSQGNVYFSWAGHEAGGKPSGEVNLFVTKSSDGGRTWKTILIDVSQAPPQCGSCGWAYWSAQMALDVDAADNLYVLWSANSRKFGVLRMYFAVSENGGRSWIRRQDVSGAKIGSNNLFPAIVANGNGNVHIAWQDDRNGWDDGSDDPGARWNTFYRSSTDGGAAWSREVQLSRPVDGYRYKREEPKDGYLEPYGDYFELDTGGGMLHALWGEAPSYWGPGNVWYTRL